MIKKCFFYIFFTTTIFAGIYIDNAYIQAYHDKFEIDSLNVDPFYLRRACCNLELDDPICEAIFSFSFDTPLDTLRKYEHLNYYSITLYSPHYYSDIQFFATFPLSKLFLIADLPFITAIRPSVKVRVRTQDPLIPKYTKYTNLPELEIKCELMDTIKIFNDSMLVRTLVCPRRWNGTNEARRIVPDGIYTIHTQDSTYRVKMKKNEKIIRRKFIQKRIKQN